MRNVAVIPLRKEIEADREISQRIKGFAKLRAVQLLIGGKLVLIERDASRAKLFDFYQANGFKSWSSRHSESDGIDYDQMICVLGPAAVGRAA